MTTNSAPGNLSRRNAMKAVSAFAAATAVGCKTHSAPTTLVAHKGYAWFGGQKNPAVLFNGQFPGPTLALKQHERTRVPVENRLNEPLSIHWHGLRVANAQDGVGGLTQPSIEPGETYIYDLMSPDAGTFWYHPHINSFLQVAQGLFGPLIVSSPHEPGFAQDHLVMHSEAFVYKSNGQLALDQTYDLANPVFDDSMAYLQLLNGAFSHKMMIERGTWNRLRLVAAGPMAGSDLQATGLEVCVIALDAHPIVPMRLEGPFAFKAGQRVDLAVAAKAEAQRGKIRVGSAFPGFPQSAIEIDFEAAATDADQLSPPPQLPHNPVRVADMSSPARAKISIGMAGRQQAAKFEALGRALGDPFRLPKQFWTLNGQSMPEQYQEILCGQLEPLFSINVGQTCLLDIENRTEEGHPFHLHGYSFTCLSVEDKINGIAPIRDTISVPAHSTRRVAFVADAPGKWMLHCHHIGHQAQGLMGWYEVV